MGEKISECTNAPASIDHACLADGVLLTGTWLVTAPPDDTWCHAVPPNASPVPLAFNKRLDLDALSGHAGRALDEYAAYFRLSSSRPLKIPFGIGADWWFEICCNGATCLSNLDSPWGNGCGRFDVWNNPFMLELRQGDNLLAVKIRRGRIGWGFVCGPAAASICNEIPEVPWQPGHRPTIAKHTGEIYRLIVLGDTHFDTVPEKYHADYSEPDQRLNDIQREEFARNAAMWRQRCPRMITAAASKRTPDTKAVIQTGDLIQGDCGNPEVHSRMLMDVLHQFKQSFGEIPFLTTCGNHDIRGTGAEAAYEKTMPSYHSKELGQTISDTTFSFMMGGDLFLFIDFNNPDLHTIIRAFDEHPEARYKFVVTHGSVLPSDYSACRWFLFGNSDRIRRTVTELMLKNDVIVLTGHVHDLEFTEMQTEHGRITQLMANSVWESDSMKNLKELSTTPAEYGIFQDTDDGQKLFDEYRPAITRYWRAIGAGFYVLNIAPDGVTADYYGGDSTEPSRHFQIRP